MWEKIRSLMRNNPPVVDVSSTLRRRSIRLIPTRAGLGVSAGGNVEICQDSGWQCLLLAMRADLPDATTLMVRLNHEPVGSILLSGREAEFELGVSESEALPYGLQAVSDIRTVMVATLDGTALLTGAFPAING